MCKNANYSICYINLNVLLIVDRCECLEYVVNSHNKHTQLMSKIHDLAAVRLIHHKNMKFLFIR